MGDVARRRNVILGISALYHDSAAAVLVDGEIVAAAQEERFTRVRHDASMPVHAIEFCLARAGVTAEELDWVAFYEKPLRHFDRILETHFAYAPLSFAAFRKAIPLWLEEKLHIPRAIRRALGGRYRGKLVFVEHHEAHAASAFLPSPFERAAVITCDGAGEWATTTWGVGEGNRVRIEQQISFPHSIGLLYSAFTYFCGFKVNSGEYKLMGLAPYGEPRFASTIREKLIDLKDDGSFRLAMEYFSYGSGLTMTNARFAELFGGAPRAPESPITQREMDLAASIQVVTEEIVLRIARHAHARTGMRDLCLAGGVALNCVANGRLLREGPFERIWIQPAAGDAGGALGAALFTRHTLLEKERTTTPADAQKGSLLGPSYDDAEIGRVLDACGARYTRFEDEPSLLARTASLLAERKVVGWFQGRMEFGPRALGSRSILGDARDPHMQSTMNLKIKYRESFRPFAPCVLRERASELFDIEPHVESPYMLLVANVRRELLREPDDEARAALRDPDLCKRANVPRSTIPAVTHVDGSARIQTVDEERHGRFYRLLRAFDAQTGSPVLINTSFNVRGEPIVATPADAYTCFMSTEMDALVIGDHLLLKSEQPRVDAAATRAHLAQFSLD